MWTVIAMSSGAKADPIINGRDKVVPELVRDALLACDIYCSEAVVYGKRTVYRCASGG
jgi:hypothetical protein